MSTADFELQPVGAYAKALGIINDQRQSIDHLTKRVAELERDLATARRDALLHAAEICRKGILRWDDPMARAGNATCEAVAQAIEAEARKVGGE